MIVDRILSLLLQFCSILRSEDLDYVIINDDEVLVFTFVLALQVLSLILFFCFFCSSVLSVFLFLLFFSYSVLSVNLFSSSVLS